MENRILKFLSMPIGEHTPVFMSIIIMWFVLALLYDKIIMFAISITVVLTISCFAEKLLNKK